MFSYIEIFAYFFLFTSSGSPSWIEEVSKVIQENHVDHKGTKIFITMEALGMILPKLPHLTRVTPMNLCLPELVLVIVGIFWSRRGPLQKHPVLFMREYTS